MSLKKSKWNPQLGECVGARGLSRRLQFISAMEPNRLLIRLFSKQEEKVLPKYQNLPPPKELKQHFQMIRQKSSRWKGDGTDTLREKRNPKQKHGLEQNSYLKSPALTKQLKSFESSFCSDAARFLSPRATHSEGWGPTLISQFTGRVSIVFVLCSDLWPRPV